LRVGVPIEWGDIPRVSWENTFWNGAEAQQNYVLLGKGHFATIDNATHRLTPAGLRPNYYHWVALSKRNALDARNAGWFGLLNMTRPLRKKLGLRQRHSPETPR
jgi:hypothetical protein